MDNSKRINNDLENITQKTKDRTTVFSSLIYMKYCSLDVKQQLINQIKFIL